MELPSGKADISHLLISEIPPQKFQDQPATPEVSVSLAGYDRKLWNDETGQVETVQVDAVPLVLGVDYEVSYQGNDAPGRAKALITGKGLFTGVVEKEFALYGKGDVNMNGFLNIVDAQIAYDIALGMYSDQANYEILRRNADVSGDDGVVDAADALAIQYAALFGWE